MSQSPNKQNLDDFRQHPAAMLTLLRQISALAFVLAFSVFGLLVLGWWLDQQLGTTPLAASLGGLLGALFGFYRAGRKLLKTFAASLPAAGAGAAKKPVAAEKEASATGAVEE